MNEKLKQHKNGFTNTNFMATIGYWRPGIVFWHFYTLEAFYLKLFIP